MTVLNKKSGRTTARSAAPVLRLAAVSIVTLTLTACGQHGRYAEPAGYVISDSAQRHSISVTKKPVYLDINVDSGAGGLTGAQAEHVRGFVRQYQSEGTGRITIMTPSGTVNEGAAFEAMKEIRAVLDHEGVPAGNLELSPYHDEGDPQPPIKVSFTRYVAKAPECGVWPDDLTRTQRNDTYHNFGCSDQRNLALMVANPKDLVEPRGGSTRSSERRDLVWEKYIKGESTISKRDQEEQVTISEVGDK